MVKTPAIIVRKPQDIQPVTNDMLVGALRRELTYQFGMECATRTQRMRDAGKDVPQVRKQGWNKNMRLQAEIPAREYFRILQEVDKHFFQDKKNVNKLVQDHPELKGGIGV